MELTKKGKGNLIIYGNHKKITIDYYAYVDNCTYEIEFYYTYKEKNYEKHF